MALPIIFSPAIGEALHIQVSEARTSNDTLTLVFKATLGLEDYTRVAKGHIQVQLWSNLPATASGLQDQWSAFDFQVGSDDQLAGPPEERFRTSGPRRVNLAIVDNNTQPAANDLTLEIPVDLSTFSGDRRFGFTYRIVYGDGGIVWLGTHGRDGIVVLIGAKLAEVELGEGWKSAGDFGGQGLVHDVQGDSIEGQCIAKLLNIGNYHIWSFDENQSLHSSSSKGPIQDARSLLILPRQPGLGQYNEPAYVLSASGSTLLSVSTSTGLVTASGIGSALLQTCYDSRRLPDLVTDALVHSGMSDKVRLVKTECWILLLSPRELLPTKGLLVPTFSSPKKQGRIAVDLASLAEVLTSPVNEVATTQFCIFSPSTHDLEYVELGSTADVPTGPDAEVEFGVPIYGGEFALSKVYDLNDEEDPKCKVALLTAHEPVTVRQPGADVKPAALPTPPPSPLLNRRTTATVTFSPDPVVIPRVDTADIDEHVLRRRSGPSSKPVEEPETYAEDQPSPSPKGSEVQRKPEGSTTAAIKRRGLLRLFKGIISLVRIYTGAVFYLFYFMSLGPLFGRRSRASGSPAGASSGTVESETELDASEDVEEPTSAGSGTRFGVGEEDSCDESNDLDETSSDVTVTGSDDQNLALGSGEKLTAEPTPAPEDLEPVAPHPDEVPYHDDLLTTELCPSLNQESGKIQLVLMTPRAAKGESDDVSPSGFLKRITVNSCVPDTIAVRTLKGGENSWSSHLVEFPLPTSATAPIILKVHNRT